MARSDVERRAALDDPDVKRAVGGFEAVVYGPGCGPRGSSAVTSLCQTIISAAIITA